MLFLIIVQFCHKVTNFIVTKQAKSPSLYGLFLTNDKLTA